jgi:hypothetical protein
MPFDLESLLVPLSEDAPCGSDLEYDPAFLELESAGAGKPEQQYGDTVIPAKPPEWTLVQEHAIDLAHRTRDLRVAVWLLRGGARLHGWTGAVAGLQLLNGLLSRHWAQLHPQLDAADGNNPLLRLSALSPMTPQESPYPGPPVVLGDIREARLQQSEVHRPQPRTAVQIEYDVELYGAEKKVQLPFVMGVMADLSGKPADPLPPVADRKFLEIDVDNFDAHEGDEAAGGLPGAQHADRRRQAGRRHHLREHGRLLAGRRGAQGRGLKQAARGAQQLANLVTYMDGKTGAEELLAKLIKRPGPAEVAGRHGQAR